ncbi:MAG: chorismate dehydratase [Rhodothermales bacterium]|jgi:chorismate dehydratase
MSDSKRLRISIWDDPRLHAFGEALKSDQTEVSFDTREAGGARVGAGLVDVALIPTHRAVELLEDFDVLPAVAYSGWSTPHATISLREGFQGKPETLVCADPTALESQVGRIILQEHYSIAVKLGPLSGPAAASDADAVLAFDEPAPNDGSLTLDLGQEWYELTNYPMVWGLFVMRQGELDADVVRILREAAAAVESADDLDGTVPGEDGMGLPRFRFDDIVTASLTELCRHLYFYGVTEELREIEPAKLSETANIGNDTRDPML